MVHLTGTDIIWKTTKNIKDKYKLWTRNKKYKKWKFALIRLVNMLFAEGNYTKKEAKS